METRKTTEKQWSQVRNMRENRENQPGERSKNS